MPARVWNILMILLIGPFAWFTWRRPKAHNHSGDVA